MAKQKVRDEGRENKYFHQMLNMADDDLDPYQYRLLGHYKRVCGESEDGACWESTRTTAKNTKMSVGKVASSRRELQALGYIRIKNAEADETLTISLCDLWAVNISRYAKRSPGEQPVHEVNDPVHAMNESVHQVKQRRTIEEEPVEEERIEEEAADRAREFGTETAAATASETTIQTTNLLVEEKADPGDLSAETLTPGSATPPLPADAIGRVMRMFSDNIAPLTPLNAQDLTDQMREYGSDAVEYGIREAVKHNKPTPAYVEAVARRKATEPDRTKPTHAEALEQDGNRFISGPFADFIEH